MHPQLMRNNHNTCALQIRNARSNYGARPVSASNMPPVIFRHITALEFPPLFFLSVRHIIQAHAFLIEVEFDFCSQCCDVDTFWTSCPARLYHIMIYHPEDKHPEMKMSRAFLFQKEHMCNLSPWWIKYRCCRRVRFWVLLSSMTWGSRNRPWQGVLYLYHWYMTSLLHLSGWIMRHKL